jgi:S-layer protein (TIGR01564 family)
VVKLAIGKKTKEFTISDGDKNVLGYARAVVDEDDDGITNEFRLEDDQMTVARDSTEQLGNTDSYFKYTDDHEIDIIRKKTTTVASGSDLDSGKSPYVNFLSKDVNVRSVGGTAQAISLSVISDTGVTADDKSDYNLVIVGGPVANALTADLVTSGKSTVDWFTSAGEFEVIDDAFSAQQFAIIVAGEDRAATATAAEALAALV